MDLPTIVNLALQGLGTRTNVTAAELAANNTNEAIQANLAITQTRDELLRLAPWDCARAMTDLTYITSLPGTPENQVPPANQLQWTPGLPLPPWTYEYAYPPDCLRALWIVPQFNPGVVGTPIFPVVTPAGYATSWHGPPIKFDVATDNFYNVTGAAVASGGAGYAVGDQIELAAGPTGVAPIGAPATLQVSSVDVNGAVTGVSVVPSVMGTTYGGSYFQPQPNPQAQGSTSGAGSGATFNLTYSTLPGQQRVILTNQEYATLSYIKQVQDTNIMDSLFQRAWYNVLGGVLAIALTGDKALANMRITIANALIHEARSVDANEGLTVNDVTPDFLRVRGIVYSDYWNMGFGYGWDAYGLWPMY